MGFLDNSGDIILDAVLTDAGRKRMARGDGTFKVTKYAFGDDEINYGIYDPNHASGSAYYDLQILQTPVLEAFTNNRSSLKSKLISLTNNNLMFLPVVILNQTQPMAKFPPSTNLGSGTFIVSVDPETTTALNNNGLISPNGDPGFTDGTCANCNQGTNHFIRTDQGLDTVKLDAENQLSAELTERQYLIQVDNRFGRIVDIYNNSAQASPAFIDDDQIASYYVTEGVGLYIVPCETGKLPGGIGAPGGTGAGAADAYEQLTGPRGTKLRFSILAQNNLRASTFLFQTMGTTKTLGTDNFFIIDTTIKVTGVTTGYQIDIPVRYVKLNA